MTITTGTIMQGMIERGWRLPVPPEDRVIECPNCYGSGADLNEVNEPIDCPLCNGRGAVLEVNLPQEWREYTA